MPSFEFKRANHFDNIELFSSENENDYFPLHFHDFYCVSLITNGTEVLKNTEQEFIAPADAISITQVNEVHRNYSLSESGYSYKTIYVNPDLLTHFSGGQQVPALERVIYDQPLFQNMLQLFQAPEENNAHWESTMRALAGYAVNPEEKNSWLNCFSVIDEIIEAHPGKLIDTDWLCKKFCMSKFHFIREFKRAKGVTPQAYIMLYRLAKTKTMLLEGMPLSDIAHLNGFCSPSHFTNSFKRYFGISPSNYKNL